METVRQKKIDEAKRMKPPTDLDVDNMPKEDRERYME